jgi:CDP-paratose 2-epimerase
MDAVKLKYYEKIYLMKKKIVLITGSLGLVGAESVKFFCKKKFNVIGIDNDMRKYFFGASVDKNKKDLQQRFKNYTHINVDIREKKKISKIFKDNSQKIDLIIHCAAQPSHDWAAKEPHTDFEINANGTLNLLKATLDFNPKAKFIFMSTNKVYGDTPNKFNYVEKMKRYSLDPKNKYSKHGISEELTIDQSKHSLFGVSKASADLMVQEFGRYYGIYTAIFRGGCLTGPLHQGAELHGFLSYLLNCNINKKKYYVKGYKGKQVRDNIHSSDLVSAFWNFYKKPRVAEVYNIGGGINSNCSLLEASEMMQNFSGNKTNLIFEKNHRKGDHKWWISDTRKFQKHYPDWKPKYKIIDIIEDMYKYSLKND